MVNKTRKLKKIGGKTIASGGYGCVFNPALKCKGASKRETNKISKLMTERHATAEFEEINKIKTILKDIPNYDDFFLLYDATLCSPDKLTSDDLVGFNNKCTALPKDDINKKNINSKLDQVMALNLPNGGLPVDDFIHANPSYANLYTLNKSLINLLKNGIINMNKNHIYHNDIKDSNILVDYKDGIMKTRLIDWGLTVEYKEGDKDFPKNWKNRPLQFNIPFSVIIFTDTFYVKYTKYLKEGGAVEESALRPFIINYLNTWTKERGAGHYKFINEIMYALHSHTLTSISDERKPAFVETEITIPSIVNYIIDILLHYTRFKADGSLNLSDYLNEVYIHIVDIWGFISTYYPFLEMFSNSFKHLNENENKIFVQIQLLYNKFLYSPRHEPYDMNELYSALKKLGNIIHTTIESSNTSSLARGIKKTKKKKSSSKVFHRKKLVKRFKKPFLLTF